jgi:riboflavin synthase
MFTGIIEEIGKVRLASQNRLVIQSRRVLDELALGDSIAVNGVCLTVTAITGTTFSVDLMPETLRRSNLGKVHSGSQINLERALKLGGRIGGHFVQGHVDAMATITAVIPEEPALLMNFAPPANLMSFIVEKGFVAIDGISLTVVSRSSAGFQVSLVAFTRDNTTLAARQAGERVNLEVDILAKYTVSLSSKGVQNGVTMDLLEKSGLLNDDG